MAKSIYKQLEETQDYPVNIGDTTIDINGNKGVLLNRSNPEYITAMQKVMMKHNNYEYTWEARGENLYMVLIDLEKMDKK